MKLAIILAVYLATTEVASAGMYLVNRLYGCWHTDSLYLHSSLLPQLSTGDFVERMHSVDS